MQGVFPLQVLVYQTGKGVSSSRMSDGRFIIKEVRTERLQEIFPVLCCQLGYHPDNAAVQCADDNFLFCAVTLKLQDGFVVTLAVLFQLCYACVHVGYLVLQAADQTTIPFRQDIRPGVVRFLGKVTESTRNNTRSYRRDSQVTEEFSYVECC